MRDRRRLLVVIDGMEVGGSQRQIVHLLKGLDRSRWQPELAYFRNRSFLVDTLERAGIRVHHLPKRGRVDARFLWSLSRLLRRGDYDVLHAFSLTAELWTAVARIVSCRHPLLIASERNQHNDKPAWYWWLKRLVLARSVAAIANSCAGALTTARHTGLPTDYFDRVPNGVEIPSPITPHDRDALRAAIGVPHGREFGLCVARLVPQKNLPCLIKALGTLPEDRRPWIALAGDGPLQGDLQAMAAAGGMAADLHFLGERPDATRLMQAADFLVLPSHKEGLSNAVLEAMAAGCPVIASAVGGTPELIRHDCTGLLFSAGDAGALGDCIARLSANPALRLRLSAQALIHVTRTHGVPVLVAATASVYERCLEQTPRRRTGHAARETPGIVGRSCTTSRTVSPADTDYPK